MRHTALILQILGVISILLSGMALAQLSAPHQPVGLVFITGSLG